MVAHFWMQISIFINILSLDAIDKVKGWQIRGNPLREGRNQQLSVAFYNQRKTFYPELLPHELNGSKLS